MNTSTLRGIFPEPKPIPRRNFIKENIRQVKQMQGLLQESGLINTRNPRGDKYRTVPPPKVQSNMGAPSVNKSRHQIVRSLSQNSKMPSSKQNSFVNSTRQAPPKLPLRSKTNKQLRVSQDLTPSEQRFTNRAMQTERTDDVTKLYETGVIKYPSATMGNKKGSPVRRKTSLDRGDKISNDLIDGVDNLDLSEKDYVKENIKSIKQKLNKGGTHRGDPSKPPPNYQKGVLPKYLQERKEELNERHSEYDTECPPGHVLLPDDERKETLRVLRQSYADRINELNSMPVRNDTLRMRKRKMEIEEELKKIDEGIKVFQRPKVFVKINA